MKNEIKKISCKITGVGKSTIDRFVSASNAQSQGSATKPSSFRPQPSLKPTKSTRPRSSISHNGD